MGHKLEYVKIYFIMVLSIVAFSWSEKCTTEINFKKKKAFYEIVRLLIFSKEDYSAYGLSDLMSRLLLVISHSETR